MTLKTSVMIGTIILTFLTSSIAANATNEDIWRTNQGNRPPINLDFAPDYSCLFDTFQLKWKDLLNISREDICVISMISIKNITYK